MIETETFKFTSTDSVVDMSGQLQDCPRPPDKMLLCQRIAKTCLEHDTEINFVSELTSDLSGSDNSNLYAVKEFGFGDFLRQWRHLEP